MAQSKLHTTYVKAKGGVSVIMLDVILAIVPLLVFAYLAHGISSLLVLLVAVVTAVIAEVLFSSFYLGNKNTALDGTAVITALLMACTISPFTPWYIVAFGAASAILFGKILWGGVGKNRFNPALVGREFMTAFFPVAMASGTLWSTKGNVVVDDIRFFDNLGTHPFFTYLDDLLYKTSGALGEYSILFIFLGGIYLIIRKRISWHIPLAILAGILGLDWLLKSYELSYSLAGVLLGAIFIATDMPSTPNTHAGKFYYGFMIAVTAVMCLLSDIRHEYMSYSILLLNGFSPYISKVFKPRVWGAKRDIPNYINNIFLLSLYIVGAALALLALHYYGYVHYLIFIYVVYIIFKYSFFTTKQLSNPI